MLVFLCLLTHSIYRMNLINRLQDSVIPSEEVKIHIDMGRRMSGSCVEMCD